MRGMQAARDPVAYEGGVTGTPRSGLMQIGQVAERTGLSLRTIRFYEEEGLVVPTARTDGGFRLYSADDLARLEVIKRMKPLGFALEEMRELLALLAELDAGTGDRIRLFDRLRMFHEAATARVTALREQLTVAEGFADSLAGHLDARR
jgi:MerR family transcriptional regulator, copper efflux regulator